uniref:CSON007976 protein n=1 Tax=Culicoides sonorensis TaxID=179676 RepID=A0A336LYE3_CULSO
MKYFLVLLTFSILSVDCKKTEKASNTTEHKNVVPEMSMAEDDDDSKTLSHGNKYSGSSSSCPACHCNCPVPKPIPIPHPRPPPPQCHRQNERHVSCYRRCNELCQDEAATCTEYSNCSPGCACHEGYVRINGLCVPNSQCRPIRKISKFQLNSKYFMQFFFSDTCGINEEFTHCRKSCSENCDQNSCNQHELCTSGCSCIRGYVRINGQCVPRSHCPVPPPPCVQCNAPREYKKPQCSRPNERYVSCYRRCNELCPNDLATCSESSSCSPGCACIEGFVRVNGVCVPRSNCQTCGANEVFTHCRRVCSESCNSNSCSQHEPCLSGCTCVQGCVRINGQCVPRSQCPQTCGANEHYAQCRSRCSEKCSQENCVETLDCTPGCNCNEGFVRINGVCVPKTQCLQTCGVNEHYSQCRSSCRESCNQGTCADTFACTPGCNCNEGYVRINGLCVPRSQCPQTCGLNEHFSQCTNLCSDRCSQENCVEAAVCRTGCACNQGFARINGVCVPRSSCPQTCGVNEHYAQCKSVCSESCNQDCVEATVCNPGCNCNQGFVRMNGVCVPRSNCPQTCGINEVFSQCKRPACAEQCEPCAIANAMCTSGCNCIDGYVRVNGVCVSRNSACANACGNNEFYSSCLRGEKCGRFCNPPADCNNNNNNNNNINNDNLDLLISTNNNNNNNGNNNNNNNNNGNNNNNNNINCNSGCFCSPPFKRASNGQCVRPNNCF